MMLMKSTYLHSLDIRRSFVYMVILLLYISIESTLAKLSTITNRHINNIKTHSKALYERRH